MKAFVSYSFRDNELYIITLLFEQLRNSGYVVEASGQNYNYPSEQEIASSNVFIGIITNHSDSVGHVMQEWTIARNNRIPEIIIIENGVRIQNPNTFNFIRFNRSNPQPAIDHLFNINRTIPESTTKKTSPLGGVLIASGIIVGLAALISLLAGDENR